MHDLVLPPAVLRQRQAISRHAITHEVDDATPFLQEDAPERIVGWIEEFPTVHP